MAKKIVMILLLAVIAVSSLAEKEPSEVWVLCQPDSFVFVRMFPKKGSEEVGRLELGDMAWTDGKRKRGFLHVWVNGMDGEGWVHSGFISRSKVVRGVKQAKIVSRGRVRARRCIKGSRRKWLKNSDVLLVYGHGDDWAVTSEGFIQTKYLEMEGG